MSARRELHLSGGRVLPARLFSSSFSRSSGPGGQNVNKVETRADLRLDLASAAEAIGAPAVARVRARLRHRLDAEGRLRVVASVHRERERNLEEAYDRMRRLLEEALRPRKRRRPTRPTRASRERRLEQKKHRGRIKRDRRPPED